MRNELRQGLVREVGPAFPALDEIEEAGLEVPASVDAPVKPDE